MDKDSQPVDELTEAVVTDLCADVKTLSANVKNLQRDIILRIDEIYEQWLESYGPRIIDGSAEEFKDFLICKLS